MQGARESATPTWDQPNAGESSVHPERPIGLERWQRFVPQRMRWHPDGASGEVDAIGDCGAAFVSSEELTAAAERLPLADPECAREGTTKARRSVPTILLAEIVKPANHIPTNAACPTCHAGASMKPGLMNHAGITHGCGTCHPPHVMGISFFGVTPRPQGPGHIPTASDCAVCHKSTAAFGPGTVMNHAGIAGDCARCHATGRSFAGLTVKTPPRDHVPISAACETCHAPDNFDSFAGAKR